MDANIIECLIEYFGIENHLFVPTKHVPVGFTFDKEKQSWFESSVMEMLDKYIFSRKQYPKESEEQVIGMGLIL